MRIQAQHRNLVSVKPEPPKAQGEVTASGILDSIHDTLVAAKFIALGQVYNSLKARRVNKNADNPPLANSPSVTLDQSLVLVPGWTTTREAFDPLADKILEGGRNGGKIYFIQDGEFYTDRDCSAQVAKAEVQNSGAKLFEVVFSDIRLQPSKSHKELKTNLEAIKQMTGEERLDVNAYSMGGLAARYYLDAGGEDIDQLMILGTGNRGSQFAGWAAHVLDRDVKWAVSLAGLIPADLQALKELSPEEDNAGLLGLNERWQTAKTHVNEVRFVAGRGTPTGDDGWNPVTSGDGLVATKNAAAPGETPVILDGQHHSFLNNSPEVYDFMCDYFGWQIDAAQAQS